ncbi:MAG: Fic family protein [Parasporobacterium sp.]|nr:Fic family protein [Parasporobacterium sp.]
MIDNGSIFSFLLSIEPKLLTFGFIDAIIALERRFRTMSESYKASHLPLNETTINQSVFFEELIDATAKLEVYKEKILDSKLDSSWFMPTLQQKEALASSLMEGTQATLDGVLINQIALSEKDKNLNEVHNYYIATKEGYETLRKRDFSEEFFLEMHKTLMEGNVRKPKVIGAYRTKQNYIGRNDATHAITFVPPAAEDVPSLMKNLIDYMNNPKDQYRPLVRTAIIHAQFETIHPFMDGNGRVGRMLIPMYLFAAKQIDLPCFFISEALERDKIKYYSLLNDIRYANGWNEWIKFFLATVTAQCEKYIQIISKINTLYERHLDIACKLARSAKVVDVVNVLYQYPIITGKQIADITQVPQTSVNRYLSMLVDNKILYTDNKSRNRTYYYYDLLGILRS